MTHSIVASAVIFGEVLYDCFPDGTAVLGGAPFNVAWNLRALGADPLLITRVGTDDEGASIHAAMQRFGLRREGVQADPVHPTGRVQVSLNGHEPSFHILPEQAYDYIDAAEAVAVRGSAGLVYHGTLALRSPVSHAALDALVAAPGQRVFCDVNLRAPWWSAASLRPLLSRADWIKLNEQELTLLADAFGLAGDGLEQRAGAFRAHCAARWVVVTRGAGGALLAHAGGIERCAPAAGGRVVDTVGAGDAFSAVCLLGLLCDWPLPLTLGRAQILASRICGLRGATTEDDGFYAGLRTEWSR